MDQSRKISAEQLLEMTTGDRVAYLKTLPPEEREMVVLEMHEEITRQSMAARVDSSTNSAASLPAGVSQQKMEQSKRISVEQYLELTDEEALAYSKTLTPEESEKFGNEVHKAMSAKRAAAMVASLNNATRQTPLPRPTPKASKEYKMEQSKTISAEQYLELTDEEAVAYGKTLTPEEYEKLGNEVNKELGRRLAAATVNALNSISLERQTPIPEGFDPWASLKEASQHNLP